MLASISDVGHVEAKSYHKGRQPICRHKFVLQRRQRVLAPYGRRMPGDNDLPSRLIM